MCGVVVDADAFTVVVPMLGFSAPKLAIACPKSLNVHVVPADDVERVAVARHRGNGAEQAERLAWTPAVKKISPFDPAKPPLPGVSVQRSPMVIGLPSMP